MNYLSHYSSPLGPMTLTSDGEALTGVWFDEKNRFANALANDTVEQDLPIFTETGRWLDVYFSGREPEFMPAISFGSAGSFRRAVWELLRAIPYGETVTYGSLAKQLAHPRMSAQAVGGAVGRNPISIIVPCHRVVGANGSLTGFGGGIQRKLALLKLEGIDTAKFSVPKRGTAL